MQDKGKAISYVIVGGYLLYLAYQLFGTRMDNDGKNYIIILIFSIIFVIAGVVILLYTWVTYRKKLQREAGENAAEEAAAEENVIEENVIEESTAEEELEGKQP